MQLLAKNGSGKSTIVEYVIRLINNLSAAIFGEKFSNPAAEHLHYIEGMDGELWYLVDNKAVRLVVNGRKVNLFSYTKDTTRKKSSVMKPFFYQMKKRIALFL